MSSFPEGKGDPFKGLNKKDRREPWYSKGTYGDCGDVVSGVVKKKLSTNARSYLKGPKPCVLCKVLKHSEKTRITSVKRRHHRVLPHPKKDQTNSVWGEAVLGTQTDIPGETILVGKRREGKSDLGLTRWGRTEWFRTLNRGHLKET